MNNFHFMDLMIVGKDDSFNQSDLPWIRVPQLGEIKSSCIPVNTGADVSSVFYITLISNI